MSFHVTTQRNLGRPFQPAARRLSDTMGHVQEVFRSVFEDETLTLSRETRFKDIERWDWFLHVNLFTELESRFRMEFSLSEMAYLESVGELADLIDSERWNRRLKGIVGAE